MCNLDMVVIIIFMLSLICAFMIHGEQYAYVLRWCDGLESQFIAQPLMAMIVTSLLLIYAQVTLLIS